jgi:uncharacterized protein (DUF427 family)
VGALREVRMSLTRGNGPLSRREGAAQTNATIEGPGHLLWFHPVPQRVRATFAGEVVLDTEGAHLLHETRLLPVYYLPRADVRFDLLESTDTTTFCPFKGHARYWTIRVGDRVAVDAVWGYDDPVEGAPDLAPFVACYWDRLDHWYDEDDEVLGHPRDPFHRVDARAARRQVVVRLDGDEVARSDDAVLVFETGLPTRCYLEPSAWRADLVEPSDRRTVCPYKGRADYRSLRSPRSGDVVADLVWCYPDPYDDVSAIAGRWSIDQDQERIEVDVSPGPATVPRDVR